MQRLESFSAGNLPKMRELQIGLRVSTREAFSLNVLVQHRDITYDLHTAFDRVQHEKMINIFSPRMRAERTYKSNGSILEPGTQNKIDHTHSYSTFTRRQFSTRHLMNQWVTNKQN